MRTAVIQRSTTETQISLKWELEGSGQNNVDSGVPFLDPMLTLLRVTVLLIWI